MAASFHVRAGPGGKRRQGDGIRSSAHRSQLRLLGRPLLPPAPMPPPAAPPATAPLTARTLRRRSRGRRGWAASIALHVGLFVVMGMWLARIVVPAPAFDGLRLHGVALPIPVADHLAEDTATPVEEPSPRTPPPPDEILPPEPEPLVAEPSNIEDLRVVIGGDDATPTDPAPAPHNPPPPAASEAAPPPAQTGSETTSSPILHRVDPTYPPAAKRAGEQGLVVLRVEVGADGVPVTVTVTSTSGHHRLDTAAVQALHRWRFAPAATGFTTMIPVQFVLR